MTHLAVMTEVPPHRVIDVLHRRADVVAVLRAVGVVLERWLPPELPCDDVLAACATPIARWKATRGYTTVDVLSVRPDDADVAALRERYLVEHTHDDAEVRAFVEGEGTFFLHPGRQVLRLHCKRGDLLSLPAGLPHWFDAGDAPCFTAVRLFTRPEGWVAAATGRELARTVPVGPA
ncbi:MAG: AraC family ligand binding domain-containing protein [Alphaproteobacteria bacterium]|nr:AraC family ligand binding domain-containing protein [Alphaproteobacteria bacterium]